MGKVGRRGPHRARKKRIADERERARIQMMARAEFRRQAQAARGESYLPKRGVTAAGLALGVLSLRLRHDQPGLRHG